MQLLQNLILVLFLLKIFTVTNPRFKTDLTSEMLMTQKEF
jgi:hypothetical protein